MCRLNCERPFVMIPSFISQTFKERCSSLRDGPLLGTAIGYGCFPKSTIPMNPAGFGGLTSSQTSSWSIATARTQLSCNAVRPLLSQLDGFSPPSGSFPQHFDPIKYNVSRIPRLVNDNLFCRLGLEKPPWAD